MSNASFRLEEWRVALRDAARWPEGSDARRGALEEADQARLRYAIEVGNVAAQQAATAARTEADESSAHEPAFPGGAMEPATTGG